MAGMMQQLIEVLNDQAQRYEELLGLSNEKTDVIVKNDVDELQKITNLENIITSQHNKLEKKRLSLVADITEVLGLAKQKPEDVTLTYLIELMEGQEEQADLQVVGEKIRDTLDKLKEKTSFNAELIQNSLDYIEYSLNIMRGTQQPPTYSIKDGHVSEEFGTFDSKS